MTYGQSDGLFWDATNSRLVLVINDVTVAVIDSSGITADLEISGNVRGDLLRRGAAALESFSAKTTGQVVIGNGTDVISAPVTGDVSAAHSGGNLATTVTDLTIASEAQGDLLRRGASAWQRVAAKTAGQVMIGDGTDVVSLALGGDVASVSAAGSVALANPQRLLSTTVNLTKTLIVGNDAGDIGHALGVELVAAVASKIIVPVAIVVNYTFGTAAYTDGGNIYAIYAGGAAATGVASAASSLGAAASNINVLAPLSGLALVNTGLNLVAAAAFTDPGTAAGTAVVKTYYRLIDA
jgi:hypothetical protein